MSKIFYDHLIIMEEVATEIDSATKTHEEKHEMWGIVDEIVHHRVMETTLRYLPREHHESFLEKFHKAPHDESLIEYLTERIGRNFEEIIREELGTLAYELLEIIREASEEKSEK